MSRGDRKMMITRDHPGLSLSRQCQVLAISRSSFYYTAKGESAENLARGRTFVSVTDGTGFRNRAYNYGGLGRPDRTRTSFNAMELLRLALLEGFE